MAEELEAAGVPEMGGPACCDANVVQAATATSLYELHVPGEALVVGAQ